MNKYKSNEIYYFNTHRSTDDVLALQKRYEIFNKKYGEKAVTEIVENILNTKVLIVRQDGNFGTGHVIFFIETENGNFVFRANIGIKEREFYMDLENIFNTLYEKAKIPVGKVLHADTSREKYDFDFQIMEILPGKDLETEWDKENGTKEEYDSISFELGQIVARQYKVPVNGWGRFLDKKDLEGSMNTAFEYLTAYLEYDLDVILKAGIFSETQAKSIKTFFENNKYIFDEMSQAFLIHHDLADHNIRYEMEKIKAIFDWENAVAFDPVCELGSAPTWICHHPRKETMIKGFIFEMERLGLEIPKYFYEKIAIYFLRTMIWKIAFAIKGNRLKERHINLINQAFADCCLSIKLDFK
jgi:aminoglycoside phosphotransferase (APT) family kinase protein